MTLTSPSENCTRNFWLVALAIGVMLAMYLMLSAGWGVLWSLIVGLVILVVAGILLTRFFCADDTMQVSGTAATEAAPKPAPTPTSEAEAEPVAESAPESVDIPAEPTESGTAFKASTSLPGQAELVARKGSWRYGNDAARESGADSGAVGAVGRPEGLAKARDGGADDLKLIKGVGPKLEQLLNTMGYFHFDQIAGWSVADIAWVDENLAGFKGRVSRDNWVDQAATLGAGEETEFARRAKRDGIYD